MSLVLTEDQKLLKNSVAEWVATEGMPALAEQVKKGKPFDLAMGLWHRMAENGYIGVSTSTEMDGLGLGVVEELLVVEELTKCGTLSTNIDAHNLALRAIEFNGSDYQKEKWGKPAARGDIMMAAAITDPAGSMNMPEWGITCVEDGDELVINGTKMFCTNSQGADSYLIFIKDYENGYPMGCVIVDADTPGLEMGTLENAGMTGGNTGTVYLNDVRVPKENKLPPADYGNAEWLALGYLDASTIFMSRCVDAIEKVKEYVKNRTRDGKPMYKMQHLAHRIVDLEIQCEQVRAIIYDAAELWDAGQPNLKLHSIAKIASAELMTTVSQQCVYLMGGYGMAPGSGVFELYCGAPSSWVGECPNDFHRDLIAGLDGMPQDTWLNDPVK